MAAKYLLILVVKVIYIFDSRIIRSMMCESMLSTNAEIAPITVAVVKQTACGHYASLLNKLAPRDWHITCRHGRGLLFQFLLFHDYRLDV